MTKAFDTIIIGAGHNGLVCANYLSRQGQRVAIVEARSTVGGCATTREFGEGFRVSSGAHFLNRFHPKIIADLGLQFDLSASQLSTITLCKDRPPVTLLRDSIGGEDVTDASRAAYKNFKVRMRDHMSLLAPYLLRTPPRLASGERSDMKTLAKLGFDLRFRHGKEKMSDFLQVIGMNVFDVLNDSLEDQVVKGALSFDAVLGTCMGPRSPNSLFTYLYQLTAELDGGSGYAVPKGGMGRIAETIAESAQARGAEIMTDAAVSQVIVQDSRAVGVQLANGEILKGNRVVSNADPKTTFLKLVGARNLEAYFAHRVNNVRMTGRTAKLHLALDRLPNFEGLSEIECGQRLIIAPTMQDVERAYDHTKYGEFSERPVMEIAIPSIHDQSLAPDGAHVLSAIVQFAPYELKTGWDSGGREAFSAAILDRIAEVAPDIRDCVRVQEILTPVDIEREFGMPGGHWSHGEMALDQIMMMRPVYGAAQYKTPLEGLYLCGAGAHPGGGVMGAAGHNAAQAILAEEGSK